MTIFERYNKFLRGGRDERVALALLAIEELSVAVDKLSSSLTDIASAIECGAKDIAGGADNIAEVLLNSGDDDDAER